MVPAVAADISPPEYARCPGKSARERAAKSLTVNPVTTKKTSPPTTSPIVAVSDSIESVRVVGELVTGRPQCERPDSRQTLPP